MQILVPLWSPNPDHWYLCVVCMDNSEISMLDSHPDSSTPKRIENAKTQVYRLDN